MNKTLRKLEKYYEKDLQESEQPVDAIRAKAAWYVSAQLKGGAAGATGNLGSIGIGSSDQQQQDQIAETADFPLSGQMAIVLTNRRLIILERGLLFGFVKGLKGSFPLARIKEVTMTNEKGLGDRISMKVDNQWIRIYGRRSDGTAEFLQALKNQMNRT